MIVIEVKVMIFLHSKCNVKRLFKENPIKVTQKLPTLQNAMFCVVPINCVIPSFDIAIGTLTIQILKDKTLLNFFQTP